LTTKVFSKLIEASDRAYYYKLIEPRTASINYKKKATYNVCK